MAWTFGRMLQFVMNLRLVFVRFPGQSGAEARVRTRSVMTALLRGAHHALARAPYAEALNDSCTEWRHAIFFKEGYALGDAALASFGFPSILDGKNAPAMSELEQIYGRGFWDGVARANGIPGRRLDIQALSGGRALAFLDAEEFGRSFMRSAAGVRRAITSARRRNRADHSGAAASVFRAASTVGIGRACWFHFMSDYAQLRILSHGADLTARCLQLGLGLAMTFTMFAEPMLLRQALEEFREGEVYAGHRLALTFLSAESAQYADYVGAEYGRYAEGTFMDEYEGVLRRLAAEL